MAGHTIWQIGHGRTLDLGTGHAVIMGVINVTPDSFSDGGDHAEIDTACARGEEMHTEGAAIIDVGGESTRPGAEAIDGETERGRVLPVISRLSAHADMLLSVDTYRAETARAAVEAGAHIVNDVWGCQREPDIAQVAAEMKTGLVIMHTGRERELRDDVIDDQKVFFDESLEIAMRAGVADDQIVLDPGFGFAKNPAMNIELLARLDELASLGFPLLVGTSRKRFLGAITGHEAKQRDDATAATSVIARLRGAAIFRVHDIPKNRDALAVTDALTLGPPTEGQGA